MKHGGYGFHPVWIHIEKIFSPENVKMDSTATVESILVFGLSSI